MLTLRAGESSAVIAPRHGGAILGWTHGSIPVLRRAHPDAVIGGDPGAMACFPLVPYCNRISHGRFRWDGREYRIARNFGDHPHAIHGVGWRRAWTIEEATASSVTLSLVHTAADAGDWPFPFAARLTYTMRPPGHPPGLTVSLALTNLHDAPAPAGIGLHPYFPREHDPSLGFQADGVWLTDQDALPTRHTPIPPEWDHASGRAVGSARLDHCFTGWGGTARIAAGPASVTIEASAVFRTLQVFTPRDADFYCVEPVSHMPDAINRPDLPAGQAMHRLAPGETLAGTVALARAEPA